MNIVSYTNTFGNILDKNNGFGPGFDFCRVALALSIVVYHSFTILGNYKLEQTPVLWILNISILPMFFGLSGFLIAGSAQRLDLKNFLINRGLRIVPALAVEIILSALVLGTLLTIMPLNAYFSDQQFARYFLNIIGLIHYELPGVFTKNPNNIVNASLWTVPLEIVCYVLISILIVTKSVKRWPVIVMLGVAWMAAGYFYSHAVVGQSGIVQDIQILGSLLKGAFAQRGPGLIPCFLIGILIYNYRHKIPYSPLMAVSALVALLTMGYFGDFEWIQSPLFILASSPLLVYLVLFVGMTDIPKLPFYSTGDYSYGIYLYGYPLQQTIVHFLPDINVSMLAIASIVGVSFFATFSWHCIEKPILKMRKNFAFVARKKENMEEKKRNIQDLKAEIAIDAAKLQQFETNVQNPAQTN